MEFFALYYGYQDKDIDRLLEKVTFDQAGAAVGKSKLTARDFLALLSPAAAGHLEAMAQKAHRLTVRNFGRVIYLYTPLYLSNYCTNECAYCGFSRARRLRRRVLSVEEVEKEGRMIAETGLRHLLLLTGESRAKAPVDYIAACVQRLRRYFSSISIEIYPLETAEYADLISAGVDGLTIYQEVYNPLVYDQVHLRGPKKNYLFRLNAPERACLAGMRTVNLGALLGLADWRKEVFALGLHAGYLQHKYPDPEISVSFPRLRPVSGRDRPAVEISDRNLVQMITALRLFLPRAGITISTRERAGFRDHLIRLGVTRMSAGSCTEVGGRLDAREDSGRLDASGDGVHLGGSGDSGCLGGSGDSGRLDSSGDSGRQSSRGRDGQFDISDTRSVSEVQEAIRKQGYQPVFKDWLVI